MNGWEKSNETSLRKKEDFYSHLDLKDITDADYAHEKMFVKTLKQKNLENIMIYVFKAIYYC